MPYRSIRLRTEERVAETFLVRIPDAALAEWLPERARLRDQGYPDRPPDVDGPTLRAWLPRPGEERHPYFAQRLPPSAAETAFPVYTATWHSPDRLTAKVVVTGRGDGAVVSRVTVDREDGLRSIDKARVYPPEADPDALWAEIETVVIAIDSAPMGWAAGCPLVADLSDFAALDAEVEAAEAEARAAGLMAPRRVD